MARAKQDKQDPGERQGDGRAAPALQINQDDVFQRRDWLVQRLGWGGLALLLLLGLLGLLGSGPLSHVTKSDPRGLLSVEYERFVRHDARTSMVIQVEPGAMPASSAEPVRITMDRDFLVSHELQRVVPEPDSMRVAGGTVAFVFNARPQDGLRVRLTFEPDELGRQTSVVQVNDGPSVTIHLFTYP